LKVIGREELIGDERYETPWARAERPDEVNGMITEWTMKHTKQEAMEIVGRAGVPAGAVLDTLELYNDPTFEHRGIMQTIQHPANGPFKMVSWPVRFAGTPPPVKSSPMLGEHNEDVLTHWLGLDGAAIGDLRGKGVVG
jgi:crotonobetainyl-CoA:carnitine CoA-transferase CaiB-like acyl-CoA transferase